MRNLLDTRRDGVNAHTERRLHLNLSSEAQSNLSIVSRLDVPSIMGLSAQYKQFNKAENSYTMKLLVRF